MTETGNLTDWPESLQNVTATNYLSQMSTTSAQTYSGSRLWTWRNQNKAEAFMLASIQRHVIRIVELGFVESDIVPINAWQNHTNVG